MTEGLRLSRRRFLLGAASATSLLGASAWVGCTAASRSPDRAAAREANGGIAALGRGHTWLWSAQAPDGRFASATYGLLRSGQSLTPFALDSLLASSPGLLDLPADRVDHAIDAMIRMQSADGSLGLQGPSADYPCYATGLFLSCLGGARREGWQDKAVPSIAWLRSQQLRGAEGWAGHPAQGGWGMGTRVRLRPPHAGHVDLSMTRRVLEGLRAAGLAADDPALVEARDFVARCQTSDGSFVYSPVELALNKGLRASDGSPRGYGSATTDGLLCLRALSRDRDGAFERALQWLRDNHRVDRNPGLDGGPMEPFAEAMRGYYRAGAARCFAAFGGPDRWRLPLIETIASEQRDDGSFVGTNGLQKEDDPIIGTSFAVQALAAALAPSSSPGRARPDR